MVAQLSAFKPTNPEVLEVRKGKSSREVAQTPTSAASTLVSMLGAITSCVELKSRVGKGTDTAGLGTRGTSRAATPV